MGSDSAEFIAGATSRASKGWRRGRPRLDDVLVQAVALVRVVTFG
jgi:hypothetical protein